MFAANGQLGERRNVPEGFGLGFGAGSRNRTHDQRFTKPLLYQLSYAGTVAQCDDSSFYSVPLPEH